jgi:phosphatidylglycerophosphate synthase
MEARTFYAQHRGGGLLTEALNQRTGSWLALLAYRVSLGPSAVTVAGLLVGVAGSVSIVAFGQSVAWLGLVSWHLAYSLDCADGQLARATGRTSPIGARLDVLCDLAVQIGVITAISVVAARSSSGPAVWLPPLFAGAWLVNLLTSVLAAGPGAASLLPSGSPVVRAVKLIRDYSFMITVGGLVIWWWPEGTPWLMVLFTLVNGGFLVLSIIQALRRTAISR